MAVFRHFLWALVLTAACSSSPEPGSVVSKAKNKIDERVALRTLEEQAPEEQPVEPIAADQLQKNLQECFDAMIAQDGHKVRLCFTKDARAMHVDASNIYEGPSDIVNTLYQPAWSAFPDLRGGSELVLQKGPDVAVMAWAKGTHTGALSGLEPTKKVVATNSLKVLKVANDGRISFEASFSDGRRVRGQLGASKESVRPPFENAPKEKGWFPAKDNEVEKANETVVAGFVDQLIAGESSKLGDFLAGDFALVDYALLEDLKGAEALRSEFDELLVAFPELKMTSRLRWAAGDYVLQILTLQGQNKGPWPRYKWEANQRQSKVNIGLVFYVKEGKIKRAWRYWDAGLALERIGYVAPESP